MRALSSHKNLPSAPVPSPMDKLAYTIPEAARLSSLGQTSIYKAIKEGGLKCRKYGTRSIIMRADLVSFLENLPVEGEGADVTAVDGPETFDAAPGRKRRRVT